MCINNYPPGAEFDPNAPYNQIDSQDPIEVEVYSSITLSKPFKLMVDDYTAEYWEDSEMDDESHVFTESGVSYDYSDCNLLKAFKNQETTIPELLERLKCYLTEDLANTSPLSGKGRELQRLIDACDNWTVDEEEVIKD